MTAPLIVNREDMTSVWIGDWCTFCDVAFAMAEPIEFGIGWPNRFDPVGETVQIRVANPCEDHDGLVRITACGGRYALTFNSESADWTPDGIALSGLRRHLRETAVQRGTAESLMRMMMDLPAWGVDLSADPAIVQERLLTVMPWAGEGHTPLGMAEWADAGVRHPTGRAEWARHGFTPAEVKAWAAKGVDEAWQAKHFEHAGAGPDDITGAVTTARFWAFTRLANVPETTEWADLVLCASPGFAEVGHLAGQDPATISALALALDKAMPRVPNTPLAGYDLRMLNVHSVWDTTREPQFLNFARGLHAHGLDWSDARTCLQAGMGLWETATFLRDGGDMHTVALIGGLR